MGMEHCSHCGGLYPMHAIGCPFHEDRKVEGNLLAFLALPFIVLAVPFVFVVFPVAALLALVVAVALNWGGGMPVMGSGVFWLTTVICLIPLLLGLNLELRLERSSSGYRIGRHVLRVVGVSVLAAWYVLYQPWMLWSTASRPSHSIGQFLGAALSSPGVLATMVVFAVITHLAGSSFDLGGNRPATFGQFLRPRGRIFARSEPVVRPAVSAAPSVSSVASIRLSLSRKLARAAALGYGIGVADTLVASDYDSAVMVIIRVGTLCTVVLCAVVAGHHAFTRRGGRAS